MSSASFVLKYELIVKFFILYFDDLILMSTKTTRVVKNRHYNLNEIEVLVLGILN